MGAPQTPVATIKVNDDLVAEIAKEYLKNYYDSRLEREWLTRSDIKAITQMKSDTWVRDHVDNDPYVRENGLVFYVTDGRKSIPRYHKEIREFLKRFGKKERS